MGEKTGVTELALLTTIAGVLETASQFFAAQPIIPEPWGALVVAGLGFATLVLRTLGKKKSA